MTAKFSFSITPLPPDNMFAYIPQDRNLDNMPDIRNNYGKSGGVDPMPNAYRNNKISDILKNVITPKTKPQNDYSK